VNAPFSWPNSSDAMSDDGIAAIHGDEAGLRVAIACGSRGMSSFPCQSHGDQHSSSVRPPGTPATELSGARRTPTISSKWKSFDLLTEDNVLALQPIFQAGFGVDVGVLGPVGCVVVDGVRDDVQVLHGGRLALASATNTAHHARLAWGEVLMLISDLEG